MNANDYQTKALSTAYGAAKQPDALTRTNYAIVGLAGETGEVAEAWKRVLRNAATAKDTHEGAKQGLKVIEELGDVLWYVALAADCFGLTLGRIMELNLAKLAERHDRIDAAREGRGE